MIPIKRLYRIMAICFASLILSGCGAYVASPLTGVLHTNVQGPIAATDKSGGVLKSGSASATSVLGLVATGDASIRAAARNGGITEIHWVDYHSESTLGIFAKYTVTVYGTGNAVPTTDDSLLFQDSQRGRQSQFNEVTRNEKIFAIGMVSSVVVIATVMFIVNAN